MQSRAQWEMSSSTRMWAAHGANHFSDLVVIIFNFVEILFPAEDLMKIGGISPGSEDVQ